MSLRKYLSMSIIVSPKGFFTTENRDSTRIAMDVMTEETFGPIVGIQKVTSDEEAIKLMNDSPYGLTASVWTDAAENPESEEAFVKIVDALATGTVFLNRCVFHWKRVEYFLSRTTSGAITWTLRFPGPVSRTVAEVSV